MMPLNDGLIIICKRDCATCLLIEPVMGALAASEIPTIIYTQDDPNFPSVGDSVDAVVDDTALEHSYKLEIEIVPTLIRVVDGMEVERTVGWDRAEWQRMSGVNDLGADLPAMRPGCGSKSVEPDVVEALAARFGDARLVSRRIEVAPLEDEIESCYDRGWSDGLPVVPPTEERVLRMLQGTTRAPDEVVGLIPPNYDACTVEKAAINAVMAGCKPEYLPVVLAAIEAACIDQFCMHGLLATTWFSGPVVIVNGPIARAIGMNSGTNALGQGNRANATIGRALQLVIRNVGGGKPGGVDRACMGNPGKYTFCFAENEEKSPWEPLSVERGFAPGVSTVTLFAGDGLQGIMDQVARTPAALAKSLAASLRTVAHADYAPASDAILLISPEHGRIFREAGWSKDRLRQELDKHLRYAKGKAKQRQEKKDAAGEPKALVRDTVSKFRAGGLHIVHVGGDAGLFSAIIGGWVAGGPKGSMAVTHEIRG